jgi:ammonia channel protein AmtB
MKRYIKLLLILPIIEILSLGEICAADIVAIEATEVSETVEVLKAAAPSVETAASPIVPLDTVWVLLAAMLVFFMQPGFALVEAGFTRSKNTANIIMKNFVDFMLGTVLFWFVGFGIMFGDGGFMGVPNLFSLDFYPDSNVPMEAFLVFQTVFCATSATIVSGAMAERTKFYMYMIYSILISAIVYPVSGHWTWGGGWLSQLSLLGYDGGFHDFAGSTVVHSVGGWLALVGASSVHGVCGFTGTLLVGLFSTTDGLFYGGGIGLLAVQAVGALTVGAWALLCGFVIFKGLDKIKGLRVTPRIEEEGLDIY